MMLDRQRRQTVTKRKALIKKRDLQDRGILTTSGAKLWKDRQMREKNADTRLTSASQWKDFGASGGHKAFIGGLPFNCNEKEVRDFLRMPAEKVKSVRIICDERGDPRGFCYVEFVTRTSLDKAMELNGDFLGNRKIRIDYAGNKPQDRRDAPPRGRETASAWGRNDAPPRGRETASAWGRPDRFTKTDAGRNDGFTREEDERYNARKDDARKRADERETRNRQIRIQRNFRKDTGPRDDDWAGDDRSLELKQRPVVQREPRRFNREESGEERRERSSRFARHDDDDRRQTNHREEEDEGYRETEERQQQKKFDRSRPMDRPATAWKGGTVQETQSKKSKKKSKQKKEAAAANPSNRFAMLSLDDD